MHLGINIDVRPNGCWIWTAGLTPSGHGRYIDRETKKQVVLHRIMWEAAHGWLAKGQVVYHKCANPACCNPAHLTLHKISRAPRDKTKVRGHVEGSKHHNAKLTEEDVRVIRLALGRGVSQVQIAKQFGVTQATISNISRAETWARSPL